MPKLLRVPCAVLTAVVAASGAVAVTTSVTAPAAADSGVAASVLAPGASLSPGRSLVSRAAGFTLVLQGDGNLVEYVTGTGRAVWATMTSTGARLTMQTDGNLVLYDARSQPLWHTHTWTSGPSAATLTGNGTITVATTGGRTTWTFDPGITDPRSVVVAGMSATSGTRRFDLVTRSDGNAAIVFTDTSTRVTRTLWATTSTAGRPATFVWQGDGNLVLYDSVTGRPTWASMSQGGPVDLVMQGDGNLVAYRVGGGVAWASYTRYVDPPPTPTLDIGAGFTDANSPADDWVRANPNDPRTPTITRAIANQPAATWLTGYESTTNLTNATRASLAADTTMTLVVYNVPGRDDGVTSPSGAGSVADYVTWIRQVAQTVGNARAIVVVEPDALWFVDRQTPPGTQKYVDRMTSLNAAVDAFRTYSPRARVYLDAGTSSGSVTASRMAELLRAAGVARAAGFAVNVSSFAPTAPITAWASAVRSSLQGAGLTDPRYVVDTGRNGNPSWDYTWCNPAGRRLGVVPGVVGSSNGLDFTVWAKQPGTSDGSCGVGPGTYGGQFMPDVAMRMITG